MQFRFLDRNLSEEVDAAINFEQASIAQLKDLSRTVADFIGADIAKLGAVSAFTKPSYDVELWHLSEQLDLFDFVSDIRTPRNTART